MSELKLRFLGSPQIELDGEPVALSRRKSVAMLAYLAVTAVPHTREFLATLLWPEFAQSKALAYLRRTIWDVNKALGEGWLQVDREQVGLLTNPALWIDVAHFQVMANRGDKTALEEAVSLYQGDFLEGFTLRDALAFDDWQMAQRELWRRRFGECLQALIGLLAEDGEMETAVSYAQQWLALDNLNEAAHRQLMHLYASMGQRSTAIQQYETCVQILANELAVKPESATEMLINAIKDGELEATLSILEKPSTAFVKPVDNLPVQLTPFIGRQSEMQHLSHVLAEPITHLVSLIGPGGIGKTRLAIELANSRKAKFEDGVCFVALANLVDAKSIPFAVAEALGLHVEAGADPIEIVIDWLSNRKMLLILDNFEHVLTGAEFVQKLLIRVHSLKLLVTSRERLALQAERLFDISALSYPRDETHVEAIDVYDAALLFASRASYLRLDFDLHDPQTQGDVVKICQLVEGHPLALEMTASWIRSRPLSGIITELTHNLKQLQSSMVDVSSRHQSLQAVFDFSWNLLSSLEQETLLRLAVFRGGFSHEAAQVVAECSHSTLALLLEKSFVSMDGNGRYTMHNVYREFASEKLQNQTSLAWEAQWNHWVYFANFLAKQEPIFKGPDILCAVAPIHQEFPNIRTAWQWALRNEQYAEMEKTLTSLWFYFGEYHSEEGRQLLQQTADALAFAESEKKKLLYWKIMLVEVYLFSVFKRKEVVEEIAPPILEYVRHHSVEEWDMLISFIIGHAAIHGIIERAGANQLEEMFIEKARIQGDAYWLARLLQSVAWCEIFLYEPKDLTKAELYLQESLQISDEFDIALTRNTTLWELAELSFSKQEYEKALEYARLALESCLRSGEISFALACALTCIRACLVIGKIEEAREFLYEMMSNPKRRQGYWHQIILEYHIRILYQEGREKEAVSCAATYLHHTPPEATNPQVTELFIDLEEKLLEIDFQEAVAQGQQREVDDVIEELFLVMED